MENKSDWCSKVKEYITNGIFRTSVQVLEGNIWNVVSYSMVLIYEFISQLFFPFEMCMKTDDNGYFTTAYDVMRLLQLDSYITTMSLLTLTLTLIILLLIFLIIIGVFVINHYMYIKHLKKGSEGSEEDKSRNYKLFNFVLVIFTTVLGIPIYKASLQVFRCQDEASGYILSNTESTECWSGSHIALCVLAIFVLIIFCTICIIKEIFLISNDPSSPVPWAAYFISELLLLKLFSKLVIASFVTLGRHSDTYIYAMILYILLLLAIYYLLVKYYPPLYHRPIHLIVLFTQSFLLIFSIIIFIAGLLSVNLTLLPIISSVFLSLIFSFLTLVLNQYNNNQRLKKDFRYGENYLSDNELQKYLVILILEVKKLDMNSDIATGKRIYGIFCSHQSNCIDSRKCSCNKQKLNTQAIKEKMTKVRRMSHESNLSNRSAASAKSYGSVGSMKSMNSQGSGGSIKSAGYSLSMMGMQIAHSSSTHNNSTDQNTKSNLLILINYVNSHLKTLISTNQKCIILHLFRAFFLKMFTNCVYQAISELEYIKIFCKPTAHKLYLINNFAQKVEKDYISKIQEDKEMDLDNLLAFESLYNNIREESNSCSNLGYQFWQNIGSKEFDVNSISLIGIQITKKIIHIQKYFEKAIVLNPFHYNIYREYGLFVLRILNDKFEADGLFSNGRKYLREINELENDYDIDILNIHANKNTCIIVVSGNSDSLGEIISCNNELYPNLGYLPAEIQGKNCNVLMPNFIGSKHNKFLKRYIETRSSTDIDNQKVVTGQDSNGFLVPLRFFVKVLSSFRTGIKFLGIMRRLESGAMYFKDNIEHFDNKSFGLIATTTRNQIIGISQTCFSLLGIPNGLFKASSRENKKEDHINELLQIHEESDESCSLVDEQKEYEMMNEEIYLESIITELTDSEEAVAHEGKVVQIDTQYLRAYLDNDNLSETEVEHLNSQTGTFKIFLKSRIEFYSRGLVNFKIFNFFIMPEEENQPVLRSSTMAARAFVFALKDRADSGQYLDRAQDLDKEFLFLKSLGSSTESDDSYYQEYYEEFRLFNKQFASNSSNSNFRFLNYFMIIVSFYLFFASLGCFILDLHQNEHFGERSNIIYNTASRYFDLTTICSSVKNMEMSAKLYTAPNMNPDYPLVDVYYYSKEYLSIAIDVERRAQAYIDTLRYDFSGDLKELEKASVVTVINIGRNRSQQITKHTINTALLQYLSKASDISAQPFPTMKTQLGAVNPLQPAQKLELDVEFILYNAMDGLRDKLEESANEFLDSVHQDNKQHWNQFSIVCYISIFCPFIGLLVVFPSIIRLYKQKYVVLGLFAHIPEGKAKILAKNCLEYQNQTEGLNQKDKLIKFEDDCSVDSYSLPYIDSKISKISEEYQDPENRPLTEGSFQDTKQQFFSATKLKGKEKGKIKKINLPSGKEEEEEKCEEERQIQILGQLQLEREELKRKEQMLKKIELNRGCLFIVLVLFSLFLAAYFVGILFLLDKQIDQANLENDAIYQLGDYITFPQLLGSCLIFCVDHNMVKLRDGEDLIDIYIEKVLENKEKIDDIMYRDIGFLKDTQKELSKLDTSKYCELYTKAIHSMESRYSEYSFEAINTMTLEVCRTTYNSLLVQGLNSAIVTIYKEVKATQLIRKSIISSNIPQSIQNIPLGKTFKLLTLHLLLILPVGHELVLKLKNDFQDHLDFSKVITIFLFTIYIIVLIVFFLIIWPIFLRKVNSLKKINQLLKLIPEDTRYIAYESKYHYKIKEVILGENRENFSSI